MTSLFKRIYHAMEVFVQRECKDNDIVGILVFGSFINGHLHEASDLDLFVLNKDIRKHSRIRERADGIPLKIYRWALDLFYKTFLGERGDVFLNAFLFKVMRSGRIIYDPKKILQKMKIFAQTHKLPSSHLNL